MNTEELKSILDLMNVDPRQYSLYGELNPDAIILYKNYNIWEVFYFDEKGQRNDERKFNSEDTACLYIIKLFVDAKEVERKFNLNT